MKTTTKNFGLLLLVPVLCSLGCQRGLPGSVGDVESSNVQEVAGKFELQATVGGTAEVALPEPTGFANITGKISVVGRIAAEKFVNYAVNKDENVCSRDKNVRVQVDGNGGLQWGLLFYDGPFQSGDEQWDHPDYMSTANATLDGDLAFDQKACIFLSRIKAMRVGQTLTILNSDSVGHNAKLDGLTSANLQIGAGADVDYKPGFQESKPFGVSCSAHPWMGSYIIVRDNPLYTVTGEDGSFEIRNIPSGIELPMKFWHEVIPSGSMQVTINGASQEISRGGFELPALEAGEDLNLEIVISADAFNNAL